MKLQNAAPIKVPARLAASTMPQMRAAQASLPRLNCAISGSSTVMVVSVKSCWRASTTITKPTG